MMNYINHKAANTLAGRYKAAGPFSFTYQRRNKTIALSYWYVPSEVLEDIGLLHNWFI